MRLGRLSIRVNPNNPRHHLWCNNGTWWVAYVLHFDSRKRRIRWSLCTRSLPEAIRRRDALFAQIREHGEEVPDRRCQPREEDDMPRCTHVTIAA